MKVKITFLFFSLALAFNACGQQKTYKPVNYPEGYKAQLDVVYQEVDGWKGRIDLYTNPNAAKPTPIVLNIHGGGWNHGEKESQSGFGSFFKNGYAVANVEYRLVHVAPAPAAIEDVRCALIYLNNNAQALNIDTNKIVIMGGSAGGHLALMSGLLGKNPIYDANCTYEGDLQVAAIINKYGVTDLVPLGKWKSAKNWLGDNYTNKSFIESVSPLYHVSENSPAVFIVHGNKDPIVPFEQSVVLYDRLKTKNVITEFIIVKDGMHGKFTREQNSDLSKKMWVFLKSLGL